MSSYIEQIEAQIVNLNREIERLQSAKEVIQQLDRRTAKPTLTLKAEPHPKKAEKVPGIEAITIRKIAAPHKKAKPELLGKTIQNRIAAVITAHGPQPSGMIAEKMGLTEKDDKQRMYAALWTMGDKGLVLKSEDGVFSLPVPEQEQQDVVSSQ